MAGNYLEKRDMSINQVPLFYILTDNIACHYRFYETR